MGNPHRLSDLAHRMLHPHAEAQRRSEQELRKAQEELDTSWVGQARPALGQWAYKLAIVPHSPNDQAETAATAVAIRNKLSGPQTIAMACIYQAGRREIVEQTIAAHRTLLGGELAARGLGLIVVSRDVILHEESDKVSPTSLVEVAPKLAAVNNGIDGARSVFGIVLMERNDLPLLGVDESTPSPLLFGGVKHVAGQLSLRSLP